MFNNDTAKNVFAAVFSLSVSAVFLATAIIPGSPGLMA
ncbi:enoyl-CoA hydratase [Erythrobacter sp. YT30]|nr:enoyl-CoA hydratase [Erythrobacter sp. YT30]